MKERPILFSAPMVRAILDGRKTVTRRVVKRPASAGEYIFDEAMLFAQRNGLAAVMRRGPCDGTEWVCRCPQGSPRDHLWVRETHAIVPASAYWHDDTIPHASGVDDDGDSFWAIYRADWERSAPSRWAPSIFMPRWASRILLEVVSVRVEMLHEITGHEVLAEGVDNGSSNPAMGKRWENMQCMAFQKLWDGINAKSGHGWNANPWVWRVEFRRVEA